MAAVFDGSTSYLVTANSIVGTTPTYPVLLGSWVKFDAVTAIMGVMSVSDNAALGALDRFLTYVHGATAGDPVRTNTTAAGGGATESTLNGATAGSWIFVGSVWTSTTSRQSILGTSLGNNSTPLSNPTGFSHGCIGATYYDSAASLFLDGKMAESFFASGFTAGDLTTILAAISSGSRVIDIAQLAPHVDAYQPLRTGLNDPGFIGPTWTNVAVTFDAGDHPRISSGLRFGNMSLYSDLSLYA